MNILRAEIVAKSSGPFSTRNQGLPAIQVYKRSFERSLANTTSTWLAHGLLSNTQAKNNLLRVFSSIWDIAEPLKHRKKFLIALSEFFRLTANSSNTNNLKLIYFNETDSKQKACISYFVNGVKYQMDIEGRHLNPEFPGNPLLNLTISTFNGKNQRYLCEIRIGCDQNRLCLPHIDLSDLRERNGSFHRNWYGNHRAVDDIWESNESMRSFVIGFFNNFILPLTSQKARSFANLTRPRITSFPISTSNNLETKLEVG